MVINPKIKIIGAGPTGSLLAIALSSSGCTVKLYDRLSKNKIIDNSRSYALTHSSRRILCELNLWDEIYNNLYHFNKLRVTDQEINKSVMYDLNDLKKINQVEDSLGWTVDHKELMKILFSEIESIPTINTFFGAEGIEEDNMQDLVIFANGQSSITREFLGIDRLSNLYKQSCLATKVLLRGSDENLAYEIFRHEGPLALLPLGNNIFQIIWSAPNEKCLIRSKMKASLFLDSLACILPYGLQPEVLIDQPKVFSIRLQLATRLFVGNKVLVGEAAHSCHPVGGQGLNLCWRDIIQLKKCVDKAINEEIDLTSIGRDYSTHRYLDNILVLSITHLLVIIFSNRNPFLLFIRKQALLLLRKYRFLRTFTFRQMTDR